MYKDTIATLLTIIILGVSTNSLFAKDAEDGKLGGATDCYNYTSSDACRRAQCNWYTFMNSSFCIPRARN